MNNDFKERVLNDFDLENDIDDAYLDYLLTGNGVYYDCKNIWQFCFRDCSKLNFNVDLKKLLKCSFSIDTVFPENIAKYIDVEKIYNLAKKKYFGLDNFNIDTSKIKIAVIDQGFQKNNKKFAKNVKVFGKNSDDSMHANAIVSVISDILPDANIYLYQEKPRTYIASGYEDRLSSLKKIYNYNSKRELKDRIAVISLSVGLYYFGDFKPTSEQKEEISKIVRKLKEQGCYIVDSTYFRIHNYFISSPVYNDKFDDIIDFEPGQDWDIMNNIPFNKKKSLLVQGGGKLYAFPSNVDNYYYCGTASYSWSIPFVASLFAIAKTIKPSLSLDEFTAIALLTCDYTKQGYKMINIRKIYNYLKREKRREIK